ncbi:MAG: putative transporter [Bacteroidales bacterium]|nr:putative transporter [Bacteroidales bacterium]MDY3911995.1 putative transporter [Sodaliphilus sp.]
MDWLSSILLEHSSLQAVIVISLLCAIGLALGKIRVLGVSLGVTFVFFMGILAGHLGISVDPQVLRYAEDFGLVLFVYALGLQVGPGFFSSMHHSGIRLNMLALTVVLIGTVMTVLMPAVCGVSLGDAVGVMCGATTNTPALGAAQQTLAQLHMPTSSAALGCAVTYPLGVVGVIIAIMLMRKVLVRPADLQPKGDDTNEDHTYIAAFRIHNPGIFGKHIGEVAKISHQQFVISRLWRDGKVTVPSSKTELREGDRILVVTNEEAAEAMTLLFGEKEDTNWNKEDIDWNAIDSKLISQRILITKPEINGRKLGSLRLRNHYGVNISRLYRSGVPLLATPDLRLMLGDRITVVGDTESVHNVEKVLGNAVKSLNEPNLISVFIGMTIGLILGSIPILIPGISAPVKLGLAGGPIIVGILIGTFGPRLHMVTYTTQSANLMLRALGLAMYLACLGLDSGRDFFATVMRPEGLMWVAAGFVLTVLPVLIVGALSLRLLKMDYGTICGMLCGAMANPMALNYSSDLLQSERPSVAYATVYPLSMFVRVIIAQVVLLVFL